MSIRKTRCRYPLCAQLCGITALVVTIVSFAACGGGNVGNSNPSVQNAPAISINVTPSSASIGSGQTQAFTATVANSTNQGVTWSVLEGNAGGTINTTGVYSAPNLPGTFHVVASAQADTTKTASAMVTVAAPPPTFQNTPVVTVTPSSATVASGQTQTFTASVANTTNQGVTWSVQEGITGGSVSTAGVYTAPRVAGIYHVVAAAQADNTSTTSASVTVTAPAPIFNSKAPTAANEDQLYTYALTAADPVGGTVSFQVTSGPAGATISGSTLSWAPTHEEARAANTFKITATTTEGGSATQSFTVVPNGTIHGTRNLTYYIQNGPPIVKPDDITQFQKDLAAFVPDGKGGFTRIQGTGSADGTFVIPNVPAGYYWLEHGSQNYFWTNTSDIDTGYDSLGRPDAVLPSQPTTVSLSMAGANAWQGTDDAQIFVPNTDAWVDGVSTMIGSTALDATVDWTPYPLSDSAKGDSVYVSQLVTTNVNGTNFGILKKAYGPVPFTQANGTIANLSGLLADVAPSNAIEASVKGSAFARLTSQMGPGAIDLSTLAAVDALPTDPAKGFIGGTPDLVVFSPVTPVTTDEDLGLIEFGSPFPSNWTPFMVYEHLASVQYTAPGASSSTTVNAGISLFTTNLPTVNSPITPLIGTVDLPTINGTSLMAGSSGAGLTPTIAWQAPSIGTATGYAVSILHLSASGQTSKTDLIARLSTVKPKIQVPPGLLLNGNSYVVRITAYSEPGINFETEPYRLALPEGAAQTYSGIITP